MDVIFIFFFLQIIDLTVESSVMTLDIQSDCFPSKFESKYT